MGVIGDICFGIADRFGIGLGSRIVGSWIAAYGSWDRSGIADRGIADRAGIVSLGSWIAGSRVGIGIAGSGIGIFHCSVVEPKKSVFFQPRS